MKVRNWKIDILLVSLYFIGVIIFIILYSCTPRPGYVKTKSGWNRKEQKRRINNQKQNRPEYRISYIGGRAVPVTDLDLSEQSAERTGQSDPSAPSPLPLATKPNQKK